MDFDFSPTHQPAPVPADLSSAAAASLNEATGAQFSAQAVDASPQPQDLESYNPIEPPPLEWKSDSSSDADFANNLDEPSFLPAVENLGKDEPVLETLNPGDTPHDTLGEEVVSDFALSAQKLKMDLEGEAEVAEEVQRGRTEYSESAEEYQEEEMSGSQNGQTSVRDAEHAKRKQGDEDHSSIHSLLSQLQLIGEEPLPSQPLPPHTVHEQLPLLSESDTCGESHLTDHSPETTGLLFSESHHRDLLGLLQFTELSSAPQPTSPFHREEVDAIVSVSYSQEDAHRLWAHHEDEQQQQHRDSITSLSDDEYPEPVWKKRGEEPPKEDEAAAETEQVGQFTVVFSKCIYVFFFCDVGSMFS